jgi:hypothetical protein
VNIVQLSKHKMNNVQGISQQEAIPHQRVARMKLSEIREQEHVARSPDYALLHPGTMRRTMPPSLQQKKAACRPPSGFAPVWPGLTLPAVAARTKLRPLQLLQAVGIPAPDFVGQRRKLAISDQSTSPKEVAGSASEVRSQGQSGRAYCRWRCRILTHRRHHPSGIPAMRMPS